MSMIRYVNRSDFMAQVYLTITMNVYPNHPKPNYTDIF